MVPSSFTHPSPRLRRVVPTGQKKDHCFSGSRLSPGGAIQIFGLNYDAITDAWPVYLPIVRRLITQTKGNYSTIGNVKIGWWKAEENYYLMR